MSPETLEFLLLLSGCRAREMQGTSPLSYSAAARSCVFCGRVLSFESPGEVAEWLKATVC